jgi:hypothetical protein
MDTHELLAQAIEDREPVVARYDGTVRIFCPHALGTKQGRPHVLVYQIAGESTSGLPPEGEWRCFDVDRLTDLAPWSGAWQTAPNLFNPQSCLDRIDVVVQPLPTR